jgi:hypothetical protein
MAETSTPGSTGAGQQDPSDSNSDFSVISFIVRQMISQLDTMKLVKIVKVTGGAGALGAAGTVDVQLLVNQLDGSGNATPNGTVYGIPWFRLGGGKNAVICDPLVGDIGFVVCSDRDISGVKSKKGQANPGSYRKYNVSDGVYVGGILSDTPEQWVRFTADTIEVGDKTGNVVKLSSAGIELTPHGVLPVKVNGNLIVTGNLLLGGTVEAVDGTPYTGNISTTGDVTAGGKSLKTHTHSQGADSHGDTEANTSAPL